MLVREARVGLMSHSRQLSDSESSATLFNMATPDLLNFENLLQPIAGDNPSGEDLKWDSVYEEIKTARKQGNRDLLDDGAEETPPNWSLIIDLASDAIASRSKDLMLGAWLTEALISDGGFAGCRDGFKLLNELLERFWDTVYPLVPEDGDLEMRLAPLVWCATADRGGKLPILLRESPLIPSSGGAGPFTWNYWESCFQPKPKSESESDDAYNTRKQLLEDRARAYQDAMRVASRDTIQSLLDDLEAALAEVDRFGDILQRRFDRLAPGVSPLRKALDDSIDIAKRALKDKGGAGTEAGDETSVATAAEGGSPVISGGGSGGGVALGAIRSRQDAFNRLEEIANFLRQVEPHSPVSYLVQRAVNWGRMPFEDLLKELLQDTTVRAQVGDLLGIKPPEG